MSNRHERRAYEAEWRRAHSNRVEREVRPGDEDEGYMMMDSGPIPADIRADVARTASAIEFRGIVGGGDCWLRAAIGYKVLSDLGWYPQVMVGGLVFRAGPDPRRDVVAFCGPGNRGVVMNGGILGHVWLELDGDVVDFSCKDWPRLYRPEDDGLGPVQWQVLPPWVIWADRRAFGWEEDGTPELGEIWFCPWRGEQPEITTDFDRFMAPAEALGSSISANITRLMLVERLRDFRQDPTTYTGKWRHRMRSR